MDSEREKAVEEALNQVLERDTGIWEDVDRPVYRKILQRLYDQGRRDGWTEAAEYLGIFGCGDLDCNNVPWLVNSERDRRYGEGEE